MKSAIHIPLVCPFRPQKANFFVCLSTIFFIPYEKRSQTRLRAILSELASGGRVIIS